MSVVDPFAVIAIILVIILGVLFMIPTEGGRSRRRIRKEPPEKDWQDVSLKLERHIHALRRELEKLQVREKVLEQDVIVQKEKNEKLQDKLTQERGWKSKEKTDIEKKTEELNRYRQDLKTAEASLAQEHGVRLRLEKEIRETQALMVSANEAKVALEAEIARLKAQIDNHRKEISDLREKNNVLEKKHDETTWIAKSEYLKVEKSLREKENELERLKHQLRREVL